MTYNDLQRFGKFDVSPEIHGYFSQPSQHEAADLGSLPSPPRQHLSSQFDRCKES